MSKLIVDATTLSPLDNQLGTLVVQAAFAVHIALGPGLLESIYESCLCHELIKRGVEVQRQKAVPIVYDGVRFEEGLRLDALVGGRVICEVKAVEQLHPVYRAQLVSYLRLTELRLGYLLNFNVPLIKQGIHRLVL